MAYLYAFRPKHLEYFEDLIHLANYICFRSYSQIGLDKWKYLDDLLVVILNRNALCRDNRELREKFTYFSTILWHCNEKGYLNKEAAAFWMDDQEVETVTTVMNTILADPIEVCKNVTESFESAINFTAGIVAKATLRIHQDHFKTLLE